MTEQMSVTTERVDDSPLLVAHSDKMGVPQLLDDSFKPHGNWEGMSLGWTTAIWLAHILSEGDQRLNQVQGWAAQHVQTLSVCSGQPVSERFCSDDRLALVLDALSDEQKWQHFESALNRQIIRVYDLKPKRVRVDSTTASGYWTVTEEGLFQLGDSKDHRPDLPQLKVMLSALDPLGLPVATQIVSGQRADDRLSLPAIAQLSQSLNTHGLLYVGDCKMAALQTRAYLQAQQDYYLCPLSAKPLPEEVLDEYLKPVWAGEQALTAVWREREVGKAEQVAQGYERWVTLSHEVAGRTISWRERQLIVRSHKLATAATQALHARLSKAQAELERLHEHKQGKKRSSDEAALQQAAQAILKQHHVEGLLQVSIEEQVQERPVRAYGDRPAGVRVERTLSLHASVDEAALAAAVRRGCVGASMAPINPKSCCPWRKRSWPTVKNTWWSMVLDA
jgi:transposase